MMTLSVSSWSMLLCAIGALNILAWTYSAAVLYRRRGTLANEDFSVAKLQLALSAIYVFGCAFRSVIPVYDIPRISMYDTWLASAAVGRTVATLAELSFVAQWALLLRELSRATGSRFGWTISRVVLPLIATAEIFSWYSVLTTSNFGHIIEESLWGVSAGLLVASLIGMRARFAPSLRWVLDAICVVGTVYVAYMLLVDVPMYWSRWIADATSGRGQLTIEQGFIDAATRWTVSHRWSDWGSEVVWMSLYFSVAVWFSISLIHAPFTRAMARVKD